MKNNFDLNDYQLMEDNKLNGLRFMVVIFLMTIGIFIILYKFEFTVYEKLNLIKDNDQYLIMINSSKINDFKNTKHIYINQKKYDFEIIEVSQDYSNLNGNIYQTIYINPYNYKTDAIITECYILKSKKTIYNLIIEFIQGGIG